MLIAIFLIAIATLNLTAADTDSIILQNLFHVTTGKMQKLTSAQAAEMKANDYIGLFIYQKENDFLIFKNTPLRILLEMTPSEIEEAARAMKKFPEPNLEDLLVKLAKSNNSSEEKKDSPVKDELEKRLKQNFSRNMKSAKKFMRPIGQDGQNGGNAQSATTTSSKHQITNSEKEI